MAKPRFTLALCCALSFTGAAVAAETGQAARTAFEIRAGSLDKALETLARQSRIQILYAPELVAGRRSRGLSAALTPAEALERLLAGTGLRAVAVNANTFLLQRARAPAPAPRPAPPPRADDAIASLESVEVTGTRIQRHDIDVLTPSPVTLITREDIEASGHQTLFDLLRARPGMVGHHPVDVAVEGGGGVQQPFAAAATTSLNALGPRATLFLVDGRRVAQYGLISTELGGLVDLDGIPLSMVERIEILRGGASAIYGADAMAGVVNIILRRELEGGEVSARYGESAHGDAQERRVSFGNGFDLPRGGHLFVSGDRFEREALGAGRRDWRTQDMRRFGLGDWRYPLGYRDEDGALLRTDCPAWSGLGPGCLFDPPRYDTLQPAQERTSLYARLQQPLGGDRLFDLSARASDARQTLSAAPFYARVRLPEALRQTPQDYYLDYAFFDTGPVRGITDTRSADVAARLQGGWRRWDWTLQASYSRNQVTSRAEGLVRTDAFMDALEAGEYRFGAPDNPREVLERISPDVSSRGVSTFEQVGLEAHGPLFSMPAGEAMMAAGIEYGRDRLRHRPDALIVTRALALAPQKLDVDTGRRHASLFAEVSLPLARRLQADLAARVDQREGYGSRLSPKIGMKWRARDRFTLRATAADGYRAPSLFELRQPVNFDSYAIVARTPALAPCAFEFEFEDAAYCIVERGAVENPDLRPETSRSYTLGAVWTPARDLSVELDRFRIIRRNEIQPGNALVDPAAFPRSLRRDADGLLIGIDDYFENVGRTDVRGWEVQARYVLESARFGRWSLQAAGQVLDRIERQPHPGAPALQHAGHGAPDRSALASLQWSRGDWTTTLSARAVGPVRLAEPGDFCPRFYLRAGRCKTPGWTTWDLNLVYAGVPNWRFSLNVRNLADREPVNYDIDKAGYDIAWDDPRGRYVLLGVSYRFE